MSTSFDKDIFDQYLQHICNIFANICSEPILAPPPDKSIAISSELQIYNFNKNYKKWYIQIDESLRAQVLKELEGVAPSKEDYSQLCLLLTLNKLSEHPEYRSWNPVKARCKYNKYKCKYWYLISNKNTNIPI